MTDDKPWMIGGTPAHRWLARERARLAVTLVDRLVSGVEQYRRLPREELARDIVTLVAENLDALAGALRDKAVPDEPGRRVAETAVKGAQEGMPPEALTQAYELAFTEAWRELTARARPGDLADVLACTELVMVYMRGVTATVTAAYFEERSLRSAEEQAARHRRAAALLSGEPVPGAASRHLVLSLAMEESTAIATRRRTRRMLRELDAFCDGQALPLLDGGGGTVLLPWSGPWERVRELIERLSEAGRTPVTAAGAEEAAPGEIPDRVRETREILDVVRWFGLGPGLYRLPDVLVEYQLTRPSAATGRLAALLAPLDGHPGLLGTLETYLRLGRSRRAAAQELHLHPNTVDYRLRRVAALTGLDPADDACVPRIGAALAARRALG